MEKFQYAVLLTAHNGLHHGTFIAVQLARTFPSFYKNSKCFFRAERRKHLNTVFSQHTLKAHIFHSSFSHLALGHEVPT
jgi:hypothetical protein